MLKGLKSAIKWIAAIAIICVVAVFLASINGLDVSRNVITVDGSVITEGEYEFYVQNAKAQVFSENGITDEAAAKEFLKSGNVDGKPVADYIREKALEDVTRNEIAVVKAKEAGISLTEEERSKARSTEGMEDQIKETYGISQRAYSDVMEKAYLIDKYYKHMTTTNPDLFNVTAEDIDAAINENYALVQHVLVMSAKEDGTTDDAFKAEAKKKAEEALAKAKAGNNFAALVTEYGEDPGMENNPEGYLITSNGYTLDGQSQMVEPFTKGAFEVKAGEVNPKLVESEYGWHIIKRCEITEANADYNTMSENAKNNLTYEKFNTYLDSLKASAKIEKKDNIINKIKITY